MHESGTKITTYLTTWQECLLSEGSDILWADLWVWWCDYWNDSSTMWLESWYLVPFDGNKRCLYCESNSLYRHGELRWSAETSCLQFFKESKMLNCHFRRWRGNKGVMKQRAKRVPGAPTQRETSPILTSVAFFSASSSFSWASLRASENLSNSSSVPFNFFCRATKSSSSWGAFQCAGSLRGGQRERARAHRSDRGRERRRGRERGSDREKERAATGKKGRERRGS